MFSMVQRSTPWSINKKNKQRYSEGDQPSTASTVPLHVYEKLQLQLMEAIDTLAQRESEIASMAAQLKVLHANTSLVSYKIESLEQTIREKDGEIETLENELHALRTGNDGIEQPKKEKKSSNKKSKKVSKSRSSGSLDKLSIKPPSSGSLNNKSHSRSSSKDKKLSSKKKKTKKRSTMHNHELSKASCESIRVNSTRKTCTDDNDDDGSSSSSCTEESTNRGSSELFLNPLKANSLDDDLACEKKEEFPQEDDSMHSLSMRSASGRRKTLPPFWNFRPVDKPAFLDPTSLEMVDEVSDLTRSYRSEFSVSIWSPSPIVKRRELNLSEADKAALGFTLDNNNNNNNNNSTSNRHQRRSWGHHHHQQQQVDEQPGDGNLGMSLWLVDEIGTVAEEEEEMNDDEILEDDSIASSNSSISC